MFRTRRSRHRHLGFWLASAIVFAAGSQIAAAQDKDRIPVVTTFSILGDLASQVGGERLAITTLVGAGGDPHVYQPSPADVRAVRGAALLIENGAGFEGWMQRLVEASGYSGARVVATHGITLRPPSASAGPPHSHGHPPVRGSAAHDHAHPAKSGAAVPNVDPHAWLSVPNVMVYVANIRDGLCTADPAGCTVYRDNTRHYLGELETLHKSIHGDFARIAPERRRIVTSHDAFAYFAAEYGITVFAPLGVSTDADASAQGVARLIRQIRTDSIRALFLESVSDPRLINQIARETGLKPGGTLYPGALSAPDGPAATYLALMTHNATTIRNALQGE